MGVRMVSDFGPCRASCAQRAEASTTSTSPRACDAIQPKSLLVFEAFTTSRKSSWPLRQTMMSSTKAPVPVVRAVYCACPGRRRAASLHVTFCTSSSRSEEHTSELQSLAYLVCRLLLEKKKNQHTHDRVA